MKPHPQEGEALRCVHREYESTQVQAQSQAQGWVRKQTVFAAFTKYHRPRASATNIYFPSFEGWNPKIKVLKMRLLVKFTDSSLLAVGLVACPWCIHMERASSGGSPSS